MALVRGASVGSMQERVRDLELTTPGADPRARERLDRFLAAVLAISRGRARHLLESGAVLLNGRVVGPAAKSRPVATCDRVQVRNEDARPAAPPEAEPAAPLRVLARGPEWVAVDKGAGQPVHPYRVGERGSVLGALLARFPEAGGVGEGGLRSAVVHRLDVQTSGVVLFALSDAVFRRARRAFQTGRVRKRYRALVRGRLHGEGSLELALYVAQHRPARVRVARAGTGQRSWPTALRWRVVESFATASLVEVVPSTGFLHQIRVAMAELGHPVLGDARYGPGGIPEGRHYLHAAELAIDELEMRATSSDPADLRAALAALRA